MDLDIDHKRQSCRFCRMRSDLCICEHAPKLSTQTELVLLMHFKEFWRSSNTGHLARLCLQSPRLFSIAIHGRPGFPLNTEPLQNGLLLFPARGGKSLTPDLVKRLKSERTGPLKLIIPDGTWGQTQRMLKRIPYLQTLPMVELPFADPTINRPRLNIRAERMSTFEAIAQALSLLEENPDLEPQMIEFFRRAADRMLWLRGRLKNAEVYGGLPDFKAIRRSQSV